MDRVSKARRSWIMSRIRSRGTRPERSLRMALVRRRLEFVMHPQRLGRPADAAVYDGWTIYAVFVHGCFWHRCPAHYREPKSNRAFWRAKIRRNCARDRRVVHRLRCLGVRVIEMFECAVPRALTLVFGRAA